MSWIIDEFSVKPSGLLASWRYKRVLIDDNGNLTNECVPRKECMNLPCTTDYNKVNRRYKANDLITEFCNTITHTNYRVYAQDCEPFAYVQTDLDAPKCGGGGTPLPTPAVPPNPFGLLLAYGLFLFYDFCDIEGNSVRVNIYKKLFAGSATEIESAGYAPVQLQYQNGGTDDYKFYQTRSLTAVLAFTATENFEFSQFYTNDERMFKVEIIKENIKQFVGWMIPDSCTEPFNAPPYTVSIRATDGLGALQKVSYPLPILTNIDFRQSFLDIIAFALDGTDLNLNIHTIDNLYEQKNNNGLNDDPLAQNKVDPLRFTTGNSINTCFEVLQELCELRQAFIAQVDGAWHFVRTNELSNAVVRMRVYDYTARFIRAENVDNSYLSGGTNQEVIIESGASIRIGNAFKRSVVQLKYGEIPAIVFNGDFSMWDGYNFNYWTAYGGLNWSRIQKTIPGNGGAPISVDDYAVAFNEKADTGKWYQPNPLEVIFGDKVKLSFEVGPTSNTVLLKIRVKVGEYYLYNDPSAENNTMEWVKQLATTTTRIERGLADSANYAPFSIDMPEVPVSGDMVIQIFGFQNAATNNPNFYPNPIAIDNVSTGKSRQENNTADGYLFISQQLGFYTEEAPLTEIIFGDYTGGDQKPRPDRVPRATTNKLYAIYTSDNSYSTGWKEYGQSGPYLPIGLAGARNILKAYQEPYRFWEGTMRKSGLKYLDVFNIVVPDDFVFSSFTFAQSGTTFDLKNNTVSGTFYQIFNKNFLSQDSQFPHLPGTLPPPFVQNPNNPPPLIGDGVFTPQFTDEFV